MKIVINTSHQRFGGAVQVALSFIHECRHFPQHEYYVWVGPGVRKSLNETDFSKHFHFQHFDFGAITFMKTFRINSTLQKVEKEINPDCIIATSGPSYFHSQAPQVIGFNLPLYIYSESPYLKSLSWRKKIKLAVKKAVHFYFFKRDADAFVVQTEDVNWRVRNALNTEDVHTVNNTASRFYREKQLRKPKLPVRQCGQFRFLTLSSYYTHKNLELIPEVLSRLKERGIENVDFVLTLKEEDFKQYIGEHPNIFNIGPVPPEEGPSLYTECNGMFLPTLAECFSASYPEAMAMERPIVTTDLGFARSICGEAALYYEPKNALSAAKKIILLLNNERLRQNLISAGKEKLLTFDTPELRARKLFNLCENAAKEYN